MTACSSTACASSYSPLCGDSSKRKSMLNSRRSRAPASRLITSMYTSISICIRPCSRCCCESAATSECRRCGCRMSPFGSRRVAAGAVLLGPWIAFMKRRLRAARMLHNDRLFGVAASGAMDEAKLLTILARLPPGITEIYLHPAALSGRAIAESMSGYRHAEELAALLSPRVRAAIAAGEFGHGGYTDLRSDRPL